MKGVPTWWRHQMEIFCVLLAICAGNSPVTLSRPLWRHCNGWYPCPTMTPRMDPLITFPVLQAILFVSYFQIKSFTYMQRVFFKHIFLRKKVSRSRAKSVKGNMDRGSMKILRRCVDSAKIYSRREQRLHAYIYSKDVNKYNIINLKTLKSYIIKRAIRRKIMSWWNDFAYIF